MSLSEKNLNNKKEGDVGAKVNVRKVNKANIPTSTPTWLDTQIPLRQMFLLNPALR